MENRLAVHNFGLAYRKYKSFFRFRWDAYVCAPNQMKPKTFKHSFQCILYTLAHNKRTNIQANTNKINAIKTVLVRLDSAPLKCSISVALHIVPLNYASHHFSLSKTENTKIIDEQRQRTRSAHNNNKFAPTYNTNDRKSAADDFVVAW